MPGFIGRCSCTTCGVAAVDLGQQRAQQCMREQLRGGIGITAVVLIESFANQLCCIGCQCIGCHLSAALPGGCPHQQGSHRLQCTAVGAADAPLLGVVVSRAVGAQFPVLCRSIQPDKPRLLLR